MPLRLPQTAANGILNLTSLLYALPQTSRSQAFTKCSACLFSTTPALSAKAAGKKKKKRKVQTYRDPYRIAQARQRKAANVARQQELQQERQEAMGDPIRSTPTPFVQSMISKEPTSSILQNHLNYFLKPTDLEKSLDYSQWLTEPLPPDNGAKIDPQKEERRKQHHETQHVNAKIALAAIASLENSSSRDRTRVNIQRCIEEFGRHITDATLPPKPTSTQTSSSPTTTETDSSTEAIPKRVGRDTGSPEVQAAILTAKINVLADNLHKKDKHNKRNLRVLVHKRQKMLKYLRNKERGGPRWQHLVEKLGIGDAMWKTEISL